MFIPIFALNKGRHLYTRRLILQPILAAHPQIDLCTKNPPLRIIIAEKKIDRFSNSSIIDTTSIVAYCT